MPKQAIKSKSEKKKAPVKKRAKLKLTKKPSKETDDGKAESVKKSKRRRSIKKARAQEGKVKPVPKTKVKKKPPSDIVKRVEESSNNDDIPVELQWLREDPHELLLSRFVETPKGTRLGESIGIDKSRLILKNKLNFYSIPLKSVKEKGDKLILRRKVDWKSATRLGEIWRKNTLDVIKTRPKKTKQRKAK